MAFNPVGKVVVESWDASQDDVIRSESSARLIVEAGPGTGKTAVSCARLAFLIEEKGVLPSRCWMISFTRTAVAEIRARLYSYLGESAFAVKVATIDSQAWAIHSGFDAAAMRLLRDLDCGDGTIRTEEPVPGTTKDCARKSSTVPSRSRSDEKRG